MRTFERVRDAIHAVDVPGVTVDVSLTDVMDPFSMPVDHPAMQAAARCLEEVFGQPPYYLREGGSIGAVATFDRIVGAPVVMLGFANADDQAHAPAHEEGQDHEHDGHRLEEADQETVDRL